jgi:hypothetical protein
MTPDHSYTSHVLLVMNPQSRGSVTLQSQYPLDKPLVDPGYLTHPYDMHSMMAAVRAERKLMKTKIMSQHYKGSITIPKSESDGDTMVRPNDSKRLYINLTCSRRLSRKLLRLVCIYHQRPRWEKQVMGRQSLIMT